MKRLAILATALLGLSLSSHALGRIGETPEECAKRYGDPVKKQDGFTIYKKAGLMILVQFWQGKVAQISFQRDESDGARNGKSLSEAEIEALLDANRGDSSWNRSEALQLMTRSWSRTDGLAHADYDPMKNRLLILTDAYAKKLAEDKATKEKKNLEGF